MEDHGLRRDVLIAHQTRLRVGVVPVPASAAVTAARPSDIRAHIGTRCYADCGGIGIIAVVT